MLFLYRHSFLILAILFSSSLNLRYNPFEYTLWSSCRQSVLLIPRSYCDLLYVGKLCCTEIMFWFRWIEVDLATVICVSAWVISKAVETICSPIFFFEISSNKNMIRSYRAGGHRIAELCMKFIEFCSCPSERVLHMVHMHYNCDKIFGLFLAVGNFWIRFSFTTENVWFVNSQFCIFARFWFIVFFFWV